MPASIAWSNDDHTCLYYTFTGPWTWDEFYTVITQGRKLRQSNNVSSVDVIIDLTQARKMPHGALTHINIMGRREITSGTHIRLIAIVGASTFVRSMIEMVNSVAPGLASRVMIVNTRQEAEQAFDSASQQREEISLQPQ